MKRAIITGATGFVGANLARRLLREGHEVHCLVRPGYNPWRIEEIRDNLYLHETDLADMESLIHIVSSIRPDWIFHLAVSGAYPYQTDLQQMVKTNIIGTINLVEACLKSGFEAFVNTGTSSEYGAKNHAPSEEESLEPNSHYAVTKASATLFCRFTAIKNKVHIPTLRLYSAYGPYEDTRRLIPTLILKGLQGQLPPLAEPKAAHDYIYIDDVNEAYLLAARQAGQELGAVYNVGTGIQTTLGEVVEIAKKVLKINSEPQWGSMPGRSWDTNIWVADNRMICKKLNWKPRYTFEQGFRKTMEWFSRQSKKG